VTLRGCCADGRKFSLLIGLLVCVCETGSTVMVHAISRRFNLAWAWKIDWMDMCYLC